MAEVTVATLNLFNRMGDWDARAPLLIDQLEALSPDVIGFQEVDLNLDQGMWISRQINVRLPREAAHYRIKHAASPDKRASVFGIATLARIPFVEHEVVDLMTFERMAQRMLFELEGKGFLFINLHLHHPPEAVQERVHQIEYLLAWLDRDQRGLPTVVAGDFNAYVGEPGMALLKSRFRSAHEAVHGSEPVKTWPTPVNTFDNSPHGTLDYIFVSDHFDIEDAGATFDTPAIDNADLFPSDHLGLFARLRL